MQHCFVNVILGEDPASTSATMPIRLRLQPGWLVLRNETQRGFEYNEWLMLGFELIKTNPHNFATLQL